MNRAFPENRGLLRGLGFVVVVLQRQKQRQIRITIERALICAKGDRSETRRETIVGEIQLEARLGNLFLRTAVELGAQTGTNCVTDLNQPANPRAGFGGQIVQRTENIFLSDAHHAVMGAVSVGFDVIGCRNGLIERWLGDLVRLWFVDVLRKFLDGLCQRLTQVALI
ncbi:MAG TPA: hypothetical protein VNT99_19290 [Methylomirabilota bacterium]|nr:hypothetical protein [Methylomirabilota bacterium]